MKHPLFLVLAMTLSFNLFSQNKCSNDIQNVVENGDIEAVKEFIEAKGNIDCIGEWEQTLLMKAIQSGKEDIAIYLISNGANYKLKDDEGSTALFKTGFEGLTTAAQLLIDKGANVNELGYREMTPVMMASNRNHVDLVKLFIENGALINVQCSSGYTALNYTSDPEILTYLLSKGADKNLKNFEGKDALKQAKTELNNAKEFNNEEGIEKYTKIVELLK